jgi:hypothetical protein
MGLLGLERVFWGEAARVGVDRPREFLEMKRDGGTLCLHEGMAKLGANRAPSGRECLAGGA